MKMLAPLLATCSALLLLAPSGPARAAPADSVANLIGNTLTVVTVGDVDMIHFRADWTYDRVFDGEVSKGRWTAQGGQICMTPENGQGELKAQHGCFDNNTVGKKAGDAWTEAIDGGGKFIYALTAG